MTKAEYQEYLKTDHWHNLRSQRLKIARYRCEECNCPDALQVHHIRYRNIYDVTPDDLRVLCNICHKREHGIKIKNLPAKELLKGVYHKPIALQKPKDPPLVNESDRHLRIQAEQRLIRRWIPEPVRIRQAEKRTAAEIEARIKRTLDKF